MRRVARGVAAEEVSDNHGLFVPSDAQMRITMRKYEEFDFHSYCLPGTQIMLCQPYSSRLRASSRWCSSACLPRVISSSTKSQPSAT